MTEYHLKLKAQTGFDGEVELDESYFGGIRKGNVDASAGGKTYFFGL